MNLCHPSRGLVYLCALALLPVALSNSILAADRSTPPVNAAGQPVISTDGRQINYDRDSLKTVDPDATQKRPQLKAAVYVPLACGLGFLCIL